MCEGAELRLLLVCGGVAVCRARAMGGGWVGALLRIAAEPIVTIPPCAEAAPTYPPSGARALRPAPKLEPHQSASRRHDSTRLKSSLPVERKDRQARQGGMLGSPFRSPRHSRSQFSVPLTSRSLALAAGARCSVGWVGVGAASAQGGMVTIGSLVMRSRAPTPTHPTLGPCSRRHPTPIRPERIRWLPARV